ncbi:MAG TPA: hypothetical protein VKQ72_09085 [Aggregatilineales bacterium]|nr:hypothetical protein [Aggregatilineales bacterium]
MPQLQIYPHGQLPDHLRWQALSFLRTHWPDGFAGNNLYRDWIAPEEHHLAAVTMTQDKLLLSFAGVVWKMLEHEGQIYKMYGLSGVFTFPSARMQGFGAQVVKAAKDFIERGDGDIVVFTSLQRGFYEKFGFLPMPTVRLYNGKKAYPNVYTEPTFMLFLSEKGRQGRESFERLPIYFGEEVW